MEQLFASDDSLMPRTQAEPIENLDAFGGLTVNVSQAALILEMDKRAIWGLIHAGALEIQPRGTREFHIYTDSIKDFMRRFYEPRKSA